jgi:YYY domain-containing protein
MIAFLAWYLILTLLGWLTFPLAYRLLPALADRGYTLARSAGLLTWGYVFWLLTSLGVTQNTVGGILFGLLVLAGLSLSYLVFPRSAYQERKSEIVAWVRHNLRTVIVVELLFLLAFALLACLRAGNPELDNAEKPMELMFINAILRSPTFPPHDSWLSGFAISYYYFGYVMTAMLAMLTGLTGSMAHNLMTALIFALAAVGAYGILFNLLAVREPESAGGNSPTGVALLGPLFLLLVSNLEGFLEVLHRAGIFWTGPQNFWTWLGIRELSDAPALPLGWIPDRFWWWWRASRVISDYDLAGNFREVIDEFPFFSFLHADLHPHVLAIPFNLLALAIALNIFLGGWDGLTRLSGLHIRLKPIGFLAAALTLGGLAFLNTWDILVGAALIVLAYVLRRAAVEGWSWQRLEDLFTLGLPLGLLAVLLYAPFYFGFSSQAGGVLPNLTNPTRGAQLWVMFAPLFLPMLAYILHVWRGERRSGRWPVSLVLSVGLVILLWVISWSLAWLANANDPGFVQRYLGSQGVFDPASFFDAAMARRLSYIAGLLTLLALLVPAVAFLLAHRQASPEAEDPPPALPPAGSEPGDGAAGLANRSSAFIFLLITLGALLVIAPEFLFLRDQFSSRLNTIFKFYYQAWLLWSLAAAFGVVVLLQRLRGPWEWLFRIALAVLLFMGLAYPVLGVYNKTNDFSPSLGWTLDDFERIQRSNPDEAAAILWLKSAPYGVVAEAVGGSYTNYARISEYTGLPTVLGWPGHESQWRGTGDPQGTRQNDISVLYNTPNWATALPILKQYDIRYVYVGDLEHSTYTVQDGKFQQNLVTIFKQGGVVIYELPH